MTNLVTLPLKGELEVDTALQWKIFSVSSEIFLEDISVDLQVLEVLEEETLVPTV